MVRMSFKLSLTSYNVPLGLLTSLCLTMLWLKWSNERGLPGQRGHVRDTSRLIVRWGLIPLVVAIHWARRSVTSAGTEKAQLVALLTQITLKGHSSGVILVVASQFASVDTLMPLVLSTKILLGSAPAELVNGLPNVSPGARSARQFEGFV